MLNLFKKFLFIIFVVWVGFYLFSNSSKILEKVSLEGSVFESVLKKFPQPFAPAKSL